MRAVIYSFHVPGFYELVEWSIDGFLLASRFDGLWGVDFVDCHLDESPETYSCDEEARVDLE